MDFTGEESSSSMAINDTVPFGPTDGSPTSSSTLSSPSSSSTPRHRFWETQPVMRLEDVNNNAQGPIMAPIPRSAIKQVPYNLPTNFEWGPIDIDDDASFAKLHGFLDKNYREDSTFPYSYCKDFLRWVLGAPGHIKSLHVGVFAKNTKKLVGFISGNPASVRIKDEHLRLAIVNILCVHKKLRSKRLVPVLIKELTRRAQLKGIWQAIYATTHFCPTPFCTTYWIDRIFNHVKLFHLGLLTVDENIFIPGRVKRSRKLPKETTTRGFRRMEPRDVEAVTVLLQEYLNKFLVAPKVDKRFVEHFVLPKEDLVQSYVVENPATNVITDFCSFFVQKKLLRNYPLYSELKYAVLFYHASSVTPVEKMMRDLLVVVKREGHDLVRAHGLMGYASFLDRLFFKETAGTRMVKHYLYNYRLRAAVDHTKLGLFLL
ncbi:hypothetical protein HPP92_008584 [Vanilla planifolia]|uniref:Glycylpeptide N-tetradecanoyltransferase n=1 Tax=Vanilla planifolia TaxID=51239 RepID=A0A835V3W6_VANPL|nr:hypothetical protein HPP92_008584 [Vanilla planifolia]